MASWVLGIFLLAVVGGGSKCGAQFPAIYNFGDDNSDIGGSAPAFDNLDLPNGQTFFGKSSGKFSDGRVILDFIGARFFWIYNIGPIGCFPKSIISCKKEKPGSELDYNGCVMAQNELVMEFNELLEEEVATYRGKYPMANFTYVDVYTPKYILVRQAKGRGFEDPVKFCCGSYNNKYDDKYIPCRLKELDENNRSIVIGNISACKDPSKYISWDGNSFSLTPYLDLQ